MKAKLLSTAGTVFAALLAASPTLLAADQDLSDYKVGETVLGEKLSKKDLKGKVVVIEYWGTR